MDNLLYVSITNIISLISLVGAVVIITAFIIKKSIKPSNVALFLIFLIGMYLYIPMKLVANGFIHQNPKLLQKAVALSINPYEKRLCYLYLADIYANDIYYQGIKDGSKAINYMEKALKGKYSKYKNETRILAYWYSIKGDKDKTFQLLNEINANKGISAINIYIMEDDYKKALDSFSQNNNGIENFLKADLYRKTGNEEASKKAYETAQKQYKTVSDNIKTRAKKLEYKEETEKYKSIDAYKKWILAQRREYGF